MKTCRMCGNDREDVSVMEVAPATWSGFSNFAEVCAGCQVSQRVRLRPKTAAARPRAAALLAAAAVADAGSSEASKGAAGVRISHRRTGALLHTTDGQTLAGASLRGAGLSGADLHD